MPGRGDNKALAFALKLLGYRHRSENELRQRLRQKDFSNNEADNVIAQLINDGYVDDAVTARILKRQAEDVKCLGTWGARAFMRKRGIKSEDASEVMRDYDEMSAARRLLLKKLRVLKGEPRQVVRRRLSGYLSRRGFSSDVSRKILNAALEGTLDSLETDQE